MAETGNPETTLTTKFLSACGQEFSDQAALRAASTPRGSEFTETGNSHELRSQAIAANLAPDKDASFVLSASQQTKRDSLTTESKAKQQQTQTQLILTTIDRMNERLRELDALLDRIDAEIDQINERRRTIGDKLEALDELESMIEGGAYDPSRPEHRALANKAGINAGQSQNDLVTAIATQRAALGDEDSVLEKRNSDLLKTRAEVQRERDQTEALADEINNAPTSEARALAEERAQTMLGQRELSSLIYQSEDALTRQTVAETVVEADQGNQADNVNHALSSLAGDRDATYQTNSTNFTFGRS